MKETPILRQCLQVLGYLNIFAFRVNNGGVQRKGGGFAFHGTAGVSDIIALHKGKAIFIEVKATGKLKEQRESQKNFQKEVETNGGVYLLVDSAELLQQKINEVIK